jgi:effector-binding domain-containing protein
LIKIGDFSKLSQVSVKTLRYYADLGLLEPAQVDRFSGYRYYTVEQLPRLNRILALKDLGLSLEQISRLLADDLPLEQLKGMLRLKQAELRQQVSDEQARLARVEARLRLIELEANMNAYDIVVKKVEPLKVAALRDIVADYGAQAQLWQELEAFLGRSGVQPSGACLTIYYDTEYKEKDVDLEVCEPVGAALPSDPRIQVRTLPLVESMATVLHKGSYDNFSETYQALVTWIAANGYQIAGPNRELYLHNIDNTKNPDEFLTEIQFPVIPAT